MKVWLILFALVIVLNIRIGCNAKDFLFNSGQNSAFFGNRIQNYGVNDNDFLLSKGQYHVHSSRDFEPYADNGGTVVAIAGKDFAVIAADTRLSDQYMIRSRSWSRLSELVPGVVMGAAGCAADFEGLKVSISRNVRSLQYDGEERVSLEVLENIISMLLYQRRSLPYLSYLLLAGVNSDGRGVVVNYDVLGSFEESLVSSTGNGQKMIDPILDELREHHLVRDSSERDLWKYDDVQGKFTSHLRPYLNITREEAVNAIHHCFIAAAEREISIGDGVEIFFMERNESGSHNPIKISRGFLQLPFH